METRKFTNHLLDLVSEGHHDPGRMLQNLLVYLSEETVARFAQDEGYIIDPDEEE